MGPKKKKLTRKKSKKSVVALPEIDKAFYELQISDLNRKLARLRSSYTETEDKLIETRKDLKKIDTDRADIIAYLERNLLSKTIEVEKLQAKILEIEKSKEAEIKIYQKQLNQAKREYRVMHDDLTSQIQLLIDQLKSLEEYQKERDDLMKKFKEQDEFIHQQEQMHKQKIYEIERKFIIAKNLLKKEMENRLLQLGSDFQKHTGMRIAAAAHRIVHENIALNNEFDTIFNSLERLEEENVKLKTCNAEINNAYSLCNYRSRVAVKKTELQDSLMKRLAINHDNMTKKLVHYLDIEKKLENKNNELYEIKKLLKQKENEKANLQQTIFIYKNEKYNLETELSNNHLETERMRDIIYNASITILKILEHKVIQKPRNLFQKILKILNRVDEELPARITSLSTVSSADVLEDISVQLLPKVKPYQYIRNVENKATNITPSLDEMPPFHSKTPIEEKEEEEQTEISEKNNFEEITDESSSASTSSITDFILSVPVDDTYYQEVDVETIEKLSLKYEVFGEELRLESEQNSLTESYVETEIQFYAEENYQ